MQLPHFSAAAHVVHQVKALALLADEGHGYLTSTTSSCDARPIKYL
jgi:hypothetical protein